MSEEIQNQESSIETLGLVSPTGEEVKSQQKIEEERAIEAAKERKRYEDYMAEREARREKDPAAREDIRQTLNTLRGLLTMTTPFVETKKITREGREIRVPERSFPISTFQANQMQMVETELIARVAELAYKL